MPQADVLGHASLVVCHGGSGTTIGALAAGCPLVVSPMFADQPYNAWRVVDAGAGEIASLERLRGSVERVLEDDRYRAGAQAVAAEMRRLPRPTAAILPFRSEEGH